MAAAEFTVKAQSLITLFMGPCLGLAREIFERRSQKKGGVKKTSSVPEEEVKCVPRPSIAPPPTPGQQTGAQCQPDGDCQTRDSLRSYLARVSTSDLRSVWGTNP